MKNWLIPLLAIVWQVIGLQAFAANVIIKKDIGEQIARDKDSFMITEHHAAVSEVSWSKVFSVCQFDCLFSGFEGSISDLTIDGKLIQQGRIVVRDSRIDLDNLGTVIVYIATDIIVLQLTREQVAILKSL